MVIFVGAIVLVVIVESLKIKQIIQAQATVIPTINQSTDELNITLWPLVV